MSSTAMNDEEPPLKKSKLPIEPTLNLSLPDDLLVSILARVSRLYYPTLSLVSNRFRSLLTSPELYQARSLLGRAENCLYVCLRFSLTDLKPRWFMLCRRPHRTVTIETRKKKEKSSGSVPLITPPAHGSGFVAVGSNIYSIGGSISGSPSSSVSILNCWSHTWLEAPNMRVERDNHPSASFLDGKIYVTRCCYTHYNRSNWMEVFDLKTETWEPVLSRARGLNLMSYGHDQTNNVVVDGKLCIIGDGTGVAYNPKVGRWNSLRTELCWPTMDSQRRSSSCVIENVLYSYYDEGIKWYDTKFECDDWDQMASWRTLKGMKKLPKFAYYANVRLVDYGGKLALFWDKFVASGGYQNKMIWCAMIALDRRNRYENWGKLEWFDAVLPHPIPKKYVFEYVGAVNV